MNDRDTRRYDRAKRAQTFGKGVQRMSLNRTTSQGGITEATDRALKVAESGE